MSSNDRYDSRRRRPLYGAATRRSTLGYWVPLIVTVTIATAGLAAWIWSERQDGGDDDDDNINDDNEYMTDEHDKPDLPTRTRSDGRETTFDSPPPSYPGSTSRSATAAAAGPAREGEDEGFFDRVSGVIRRTPSPQHFFDNAGQRLAAGVAAAGAAVGLGSITEERGTRGGVGGGGGGGFSDHERWSEEAKTMRIETQSGKKATSSAAAQSAAIPNSSRRTVAIVVSAESDFESSSHDRDEEDDGVEYRTEHASILSHLPQHFDPSMTRLFVLIYAPHLTSLPSQSSPSRRPASLSSSYSALATPSPPPDEEQEETDQHQSSPKSRLFNALWTQSLALVDKDSMILPFTTPTGYLHLLRHLAPSLVYISDTPTLSGSEGENIAQLKGWVGQTVVVVGDHGDGGLADTDTEDENATTGGRGSRRHGGGNVWWEGSELVGLGKGIEIVDADHVGDDWVRRVGG